MFLHYFVNNRLRWSKGGGKAGKQKQETGNIYFTLKEDSLNIIPLKLIFKVFLFWRYVVKYYFL